MKRLLFLILFLSSSLVFASDADKAYERLLALEGTWEGQWETHPMQLVYQPISGKAAVMETMVSADGSSMVTIYHKNGDKLMATHYCKVNNQPRLVANTASAKADQLEFHFVDGTNIGKSYLSDVTFKFFDQDRFEQTSKFAGHNTVATVLYTRKK